MTHAEKDKLIADLQAKLSGTAPLTDDAKDALIAELQTKLDETQLAHAADVETLQGHLDTKLDGLSVVDLAKMRLAADAEVASVSKHDDATAADALRVAEATAAAQLEDERRREVAEATERQIALSHGADLMTTTPQGVRYASGCI